MLAQRSRLAASNAILAVLAASCAPPAPPEPPPFAGEPMRPVVSLTAPPPAPPVVEPPAPPAPPPLGIHLSFEPPFRLDRRVVPSPQAAFLADLKERTLWNQGGMGTLAAELPPVPGHPAPKVILDVLRASGGLGPNQSQAVLRRGLWMKIVDCYGHSAYKDQKLRGMASFTINVASSGKVTAARTTKDGFRDVDVARCLQNQLRAFSMPKSKGKTTIALEIQVGPGDEPMPPPPSLTVAGDGTLTPDEMLAVVEAARPAIEGCHREALEYAPELWGRLGLRFHVTEKGKTDEVFETESRFPDERLSLCVLRAARKLTFPVPAGGDLRFVVPLRLWSDRSPIPKAP